MIHASALREPTDAMDHGHDNQRELDSDVRRSRRNKLARNCCTILLTGTPANTPAELDIA